MGLAQCFLVFVPAEYDAGGESSLLRLWWVGIRPWKEGGGVEFGGAQILKNF